ncbi:MAG: putative efflux protein MATE family [Bacteroidetes bacterium]|nr:MAG: putative efflux protein MATE family [Bacteroidota bacterium]
MNNQDTNQTITHHIRNYLHLLRQALAGGDQDYTSLKLSTAIFLLSVPMVLEMIMESVFAIVDIFFVSRLGSDAIAAVGLTESMMTLVYAIAVGFSAGTTALISRRIGEKNPGAAAKAAGQSMIAGLLVSSLLAIPGIFYSYELLKLMGASDSLALQNHGFTRIMFAGNAVIMMLFIINAAFRSAGDAALSMRVLLIANGINLVLDPLLIFGFGPIPAFGIEGAAIATTTGRGIAVAFQLYVLFRGRMRIKLKLVHLIPDFRLMASVIKLSIGGILQNLIATASWIVMVRIISVFGSTAVAGYTIGIRIIIFSLLPSWGVSNAAATLVGQNLGAGRPDRAQRAAWITGFANMSLLGLISILFISFPGFFIRMFIQDEEVIRAGITCLQIVSSGFLFYAFGMVMTQSLNGAGDTYTPTLLNFICFWLIEIPLAYYLALRAGFDTNGVYYAIVIAESTLTLLGIYVFSRGRWKLKKV